MFHGWDNYFGMLGTASAGLIGLLFVVVTLTANFESTQAERGQALYMTPTGLNFASVLAVCAVALVPNLAPTSMAAAFGLVGVFGLANAVRSTIGIALPRQTTNRPHWSDLWCYGAAPVVVYLSLGVAAIGVANRAPWAVYALAGTLLFQLLLGIRNAWDLVTYIAPRANTISQARGDAGGETDG